MSSRRVPRLRRPCSRALELLHALTTIVPLAIAAPAAPLTAQHFGLESKLFPGDTLGTDALGQELSLSADGNTALVSTVGPYPDCRRARVFQRVGSSWHEEAVLEPTVPVPLSCGYPVPALSGDGQTAWVQDWVNDQAHVYVRNGGTWTFQQFLQLPAGLSSGSTAEPDLSYDGNTILLGAPAFPSSGDCPGACGAGFVYVRVNGVWSQQQQLVPPAFEPDANLGTGVALSGDGQTAILGDRIVNNSRGAAYVFTRSGGSWTFQQKLEAPDGSEFDDFGEEIAVSFDGSSVLIGAHRHCHVDPVCPNRYVYSFDRSGNTFAYTQELQFTSQFVWGGIDDVAISAHGRRALVGHPNGNCANGRRCGAAVFFERGPQGPWLETQRLVGYDEDDGFGRAVDMSADGTTVLIGAPGEECIKGPHCGAAYVFVDACPPGSLVALIDCEDDFSLPHEWIFLGCAVVDCCPWCPGSELFRIDWVIRYEADPGRTATLRFDNLSRTAIAELETVGPGTWLEGNMLRMSGGSEVQIRGFEVLGRAGLVRGPDAPRVALDRIGRPRSPDARETARATGRPRRATLTLEQRVDGRVIDRTTVVYVLPERR